MGFDRFATAKSEQGERVSLALLPLVESDYTVFLRIAEANPIHTGFVDYLGDFIPEESFSEEDRWLGSR